MAKKLGGYPELLRAIMEASTKLAQLGTKTITTVGEQREAVQELQARVKALALQEPPPARRDPRALY